MGEVALKCNRNLITQPGRPISPTGDPSGASSGSPSGHYMAEPCGLTESPSVGVRGRVDKAPAY